MILAVACYDYKFYSGLSKTTWGSTVHDVVSNRVIITFFPCSRSGSCIWGSRFRLWDYGGYD
jgi:hypothetical protein